MFCPLYLINYQYLIIHHNSVRSLTSVQMLKLRHTSLHFNSLMTYFVLFKTIDEQR